MTFHKFAAAAAAAVLVMTVPAQLSSLNAVSSAHAQTSAVSSLPDFSKLVEDNGNAVVSIAVVEKKKKRAESMIPKDQLDFFRHFGFPFPFGDNGGFTPGRRGQGSGFIISPDGYILTNNHVVENADDVTVSLTDKREFKAKVVGTDPKTDIALIKIEGKDFPAVRLGNSDNVKVGEWVAAIGAPFGLDNTVTAGIVSAKSRSLPDEQFVPFIQTDVAVNPGNSGGPLFNMKGEVIGINSQIFSTSGGFMGLSFAIPINLAVQIKNNLQKYGKVSRGRIGILMQQMTPELAKSFGIKETKGALIAQLEKDGPADKAKLKEGDIIVEFNGTPISELNELSQAVAGTKPGTKARLKVIRDGKLQDFTIVIGELTPEGIRNLKRPENFSIGILDLETRPLDPKEKKRVENGIAVVSSAGIAAAAGIRKGDIILKAGGRTIKSREDFASAVKGAKDSLAILIDRSGRRIFVPIKLADK